MKMIAHQYEGMHLDAMLAAGLAQATTKVVLVTNGFVLLTKMSGVGATEALKSFGKALNAISAALRKGIHVRSVQGDVRRATSDGWYENWAMTTCMTRMLLGLLWMAGVIAPV